MKLKFIILSLSLSLPCIAGNLSESISSKITIKNPGNPAIPYTLQENPGGRLSANENLPLEITWQKEETGDYCKLIVNLKAIDEVYYNFESALQSSAFHDESLFYMPGSGTGKICGHR